MKIYYLIHLPGNEYVIELTIGNGNLKFTIPACSVLHITVEE